MLHDSRAQRREPVGESVLCYNDTGSAVFVGLAGQQGVTHVAMESTGEDWKPVHNILESRFVVILANARQVKAIPGNKTDTKDAAWLTELLRFGLIRGSFIPPLPQRELRDLTRQRANLVQERAAVVNQLQKVLE